MRLLAEKGMGRTELLKALGYSQRTGRAGCIAMTIPEKPNSRLQKYLLTEKGRHISEGGGR
jgi:hypothetical protein